VPTLISNPRWISIINPVFKFIEVIPGYRELDISLPFLVFFSIFFGILIGDAGYGLVYAFITFLFQQKARKKHKPTANFTIFYILSFCAVIWGLLTGTFFGHEWIVNAGYKPLVPALVDDKGLQRFCFFLGALHLSLGHAWRGLLKAPALSALGDLGWMCVLWAAFFIARFLILGDAFPSFGIWLLLAGVMLVIGFTNPQKNILKSAEEWIAWVIALPLSFMNNFADIVSYIRLFAVGMAGVAIADAFNAMAASFGTGNVFLIIVAAAVALIGNAVSIVLGPVSVLVHGVRLNVLEFSGHVGVSWSGANYKPLKE
jgi:V/A-type H+-transporting ATPase subunit I